jgi:transcriptional regulator with XRE-family HTH domain
LRDRRLDLGLSLRTVEERAESLGQPIPFTTLAKIEAGRVEPGVKRLHTLLRLYDLSPTLAAELLDMEEFAGELPAPAPPQVLYEEGVKHWRAGNLREALARLFQLRAQTSGGTAQRHERQKALVFFAVAVGGMAKFNLSRQIVEDLLLEGIEPSLLVPAFVQLASCWHGLGQEEVALALIARAETHLADGDHRNRAWVSHLRASVHLARGELSAVEHPLHVALAAYRAADDVGGEIRAAALQFRLLFVRGEFREALEVARSSREAAERTGQHRLRAMRRIEEGRALLALGEEAAGLAALNDALARSIEVGDSVLQFYAHYDLWQAHVARNDRAAADLELHACQYHVRFLDESTPEVLEVRKTMRSPT